MNLINKYNDYVKLKRINELWKNLFLFSSPRKKKFNQFIIYSDSGKKIIISGSY